MDEAELAERRAWERREARRARERAWREMNREAINARERERYQAKHAKKRPRLSSPRGEARRAYMHEYYLKHRAAKLADRRERSRKARTQGESKADRQGTLIDGR
jgi:hypothetical protein